MEQTILTPWQKTVLEMVNQKPELESFYLSGGTALAEFYLHHRLSDDLDFFSFENPDPIAIERIAEEIADVLRAQTRFEKLHDRRMFFFTNDERLLKVEFSLYPFRSLEPVKRIGGIRVDSLRDIAADKLAALLDRFDPKDFVDVYYLLQTSSLEKIRQDTETKFSYTISPLFLGSELAKVKRIEALPKIVKPLTIDELKTFFTKQASQLKHSILEL